MEKYYLIDTKYGYYNGRSVYEGRPFDYDSRKAKRFNEKADAENVAKNIKTFMHKVKVVCFLDTIVEQMVAFDKIVSFFKENNLKEISVSCNGLSEKSTIHKVWLLDDQTLCVYGTTLISSFNYTIEKKKLCNKSCTDKLEVINIAEYLKL